MGVITIICGLITLASIVYVVKTKRKNSSLKDDLLKLEDLLFQTTTVSLKLKHQNILLTNRIAEHESADCEKECLSKEVVLEAKEEVVKPKRTRNKKTK